MATRRERLALGSSFRQVTGNVPLFRVACGVVPRASESILDAGWSVFDQRGNVRFPGRCTTFPATLAPIRGSGRRSIAGRQAGEGRHWCRPFAFVWPPTIFDACSVSPVWRESVACDTQTALQPWLVARSGVPSRRLVRVNYALCGPGTADTEAELVWRRPAGTPATGGAVRSGRWDTNRLDRQHSCPNATRGFVVGAPSRVRKRAKPGWPW